MGSLANAAAMSVSGAPGTGLVTLAAAKASYLDFATAGCVDGATYSYVLKDGNNREGGFGTYNAVGTFSRDTILFSTAGGTTPINATASATIQISPLTPDLDAVQVTTVAAFQLRGFDKNTQSVKILGYNTVGKGQFLVRRVNSQPAHGWKFRSKDRWLANGTSDSTNGGWWEGYAPDGRVTIESFGGNGDGITDDWAYFNLANLYSIYCSQNGREQVEIYFPAQHYKFSRTLYPGIDPSQPYANGNPVILRGNFIPSRGGTQFSFPANTCGIWISPFCYGCHVYNIALQSVLSTSQSHNAHGISINTGGIQVRDVQCVYFTSHGIFNFSGGIGIRTVVTSASGDGVHATLNYSGMGPLQPYRVGQQITVTYMIPAGYNGTYVITGVTNAGDTGSVTFACTQTGPMTSVFGNATMYAVDAVKRASVSSATPDGVHVTIGYTGFTGINAFAVGETVNLIGCIPSQYNAPWVIDQIGAGTVRLVCPINVPMTGFGAIATNGYPQTNADQCYIHNAQIQACGRHGIHAEGSDSTLMFVHNCDVNVTGSAGIFDSPFYPNVYNTTQVSFNGVPLSNQNSGLVPGGTGRIGGQVSGSNGYVYFVRPGIDPAPATFTDPVTDTSQTVWYLNSTVPDARWPTWASGQLYDCGCSVYSPSSMFMNIYSESGLGYYVPGVLSIGAFSCANGTIPRFNGAGIRPAYWGYNYGVLSAEGGISANEAVPITDSGNNIQANFAKTFVNTLGGAPEAEAILTTQWNLSGGADACTFRQRYDPTNHELYWEGAPGHIFFRMAGDGGLNKYSRTLNYSFALNIPYTLMLGNGLSARQIISGNFSGSTPPTDGGGAAYDWRAGDIVMNPGATIGGVAMRVCTLAGVGAAAAFAPIVAGPVNQVEYTVSTAPAGGPPPAFTLAAANCIGGLIEVKIILSATLSANSNVLLPTVTDLVTALGAFFYDGMTFVLTIANASSANFTWSVFGNTGWSFGGGNNVIAQNTVRKMIISIGLPTAANWTMTNEVWTYSP